MPCRNRTNNNQTCRSCPSAPFLPQCNATRRAWPLSPLLAKPAVPCLAITSPIRTDHSGWRLASSLHTCHNKSGLDLSRPALPAMPRQTLTGLSKPLHACHITPRQNASFLILTIQSQPATTSPTLTKQDPPCLLCHALYATDLNKTLLTLERPASRVPACRNYFLLSGRPSPMPTWAPTRARRLVTSSSVNWSASNLIVTFALHLS
jgi:hypothetical protein